MIRKAKPSYDRRIAEKNSDDPKNFWKAVKKVLPPIPTNRLHLNHRPLVGSITVHGKTTTHALTIANGFCLRFLQSFLHLFYKCCAEIAF